MLSPPTLNPLNYKALSCNVEVPPAFNESLAPHSTYFFKKLLFLPPDTNTYANLPLLAQ